MNASKFTYEVSGAFEANIIISSVISVQNGRVLEEAV
jgi:hypothetical protein